MYTGDSDLSSAAQDLEQLVKLLKTSHEYGLADLVTLCEVQCIPKLDAENVKDMLQLAQAYNAEHLEAACLDLRTNLLRNHRA